MVKYNISQIEKESEYSDNRICTMKLECDVFSLDLDRVEKFIFEIEELIEKYRKRIY